MLLDDLVGTIETLKERISTHGQALRQNETRTRIALIDPMLQALGWDTSDPAIVMTEFPILTGRADYAFLATNGRPVSVLEAKKLGQGLETHNSQMINYALQEGVDFAGLTDGDQWHIYDLSKSGALPNRQVLNVSISEAPAHEAALKLLLLWRTNLESGQPVAANAPVLIPQEQPLSAELTVEIAPPVSFAVAQAAPNHEQSPIPDQANWKPLSAVAYQLGDSKPVGIRFSGSITKPVKNWVDTWFEVCEWLAVNEKLSATDCPVPSPSGKGVRVLINTDSHHPPSNKYPNGNNFAQPRRTSTGLFIETNYNPQNSIKNSQYLLDKLAVPLETVELQF